MNDSTKRFTFNEGHNRLIKGKPEDDMGRMLPESELGYQEVRAAILSDPSASFWLREAMAALEKRDPLDALKDAETLALLAQLRAKKILGVGA